MKININSKEYKIAKELAEMYADLKIMAGRLQEIHEVYDLEDLDGLLLDDIKKIEECDHSLIAIAQQILKKKK